MNKRTFVLISLNIVIFCLLFSPFLIFADGSGTPGSSSLNPLGGTKTLKDLVLNVIKLFIQIAIPVTALAIVYIGFWFVSAQGNPGEINKAKDALMWTLAGFAILIAAGAIVDMIQTTVTGLSK